MTKEKLNIELLAMDVDGVLTNGGITLDHEGNELITFHVHDGAWLRIWKRLGLKTAVITGRNCPAVLHRMHDMEIDYIYQRAHDKLAVFNQLLAESNVPAERIAYIGDDVMDLPILSRTGFRAAVADAHHEALALAQFVSTRAGGAGAVAELIGHLLKHMGLYNTAMERYLK